MMNKWKKLSQLWHTVRYLRTRQIVYRIYYKLIKLDAYKLKIKNTEQRKWSKSWHAPGLFMSCMRANGEAIFLGKSNRVTRREDWNSPTQDKLWLYHLHYLHDLNALDAHEKIAFNKELIEQWIINNPPVEGTGWEPYPLSLRLVNLVKWFSRNEQELNSSWLNSLSLQAQALNFQIEYHILANHLFANAKALIFIGAYLHGEEADRWLKKGLAILDKEITEQFLADGGHFELSPMYHANLLWDVCDLLYLSQIANLDSLKLRQKVWIKIIEKGLVWLSAMSHPDGKISFFNDAAFAMSPELHELIAYAKQLGLMTSFEQKCKSVYYLADSGYCIINLSEKSKAIMDIARIGASYQPGHAHADTLSFELSIFGQRLLVNTGISEYGEGKERQYQRSTLAHNTVCINNQNSSVVWSGFRVAQRAVPKQIIIQEEKENIRVLASHTGYERRPIKVTHQREWLYSHQRLCIKDKLIGSFAQATVRFHFHPDIKIVVTEINELQCFFPEGQVALFKILGSIHWSLEDSYWCPRFGEKHANQCLSISLKEDNAAVDITW